MRSATGYRPPMWSTGVAALLWLCAIPAIATGPDAGRPAPPGPAFVAGIGAPVDPGRLDRLRGGDGSSNRIEVAGEVGGNTADHVISGSNLVDGGSFGNAAGVSTVIQNSGSNVLIQNAMIVNVQFADPVP